MVNEFYLDMAIKRIKDWGFEVINYDMEGIEIKPLYGFYDIIDTLKEICELSGINIKAYYFLKNNNIKLCYKHKWELKEEGLI